MSVPEPAAQHLRDVFHRTSPHPFQGTGSSDHVTRRNLALSAVGALVLLIVLCALLVL